jgi:hypothetical protein
MLATRNWIDAAFEPKAANDQSALVPVMAATAAESCESVVADGIADQTSEPSWLQDWTAMWSSVGTSMFNAALPASAADDGAVEAARVEPAALWMQPARTTRPRSWYRQPTPDLLDPATWGFPAPFAVYGVPVPSPLQGAMGFRPMPDPMMTQMWAPLYAMMAQPLFSGALSGGLSGFGQAGFGQPGLGQTGFGAFGGGYGGQAFSMPFARNTMFANPFASQPQNPMTAWLSGFAPRPADPWAKLNSAVTSAFAPAKYATYRSDSGHAVAQISISDAKAPGSSADEAATAIWNLFAWPAPARNR